MKFAAVNVNWNKLGVNTSRAAFFGAALVSGPVINSDKFPLLDPTGDWATWENKPAYVPALVSPVFDVAFYGADPTGEHNSIAAFRAAQAAQVAAGEGTIYAAEGIYTLFASAQFEAIMYLHDSGFLFEGDGPDKTILNCRAWGGQDPGTNLVYARSPLFSSTGAPGPVDGITVRGIRATGNADITAQAGIFSGDGSLDGWDTSHKFMAIFGTITNVVVEDCELDHWRGEICYSGGGAELGNFRTSRCILRNCNAAAISQGGVVLVEDCDIYDTYDGAECQSRGTPQGLTVRRCTIDINRNIASGLYIGKFGIVYIGFATSQLTVEDCVFNDSREGAIFITVCGSNITIQNNVFNDTVAVYSNFQNGYSDFEAEEYNYRNWLIQGNTINAVTKNVLTGIYTNVDSVGCSDWTIDDNTTNSTGSFKVVAFLETRGIEGDYIVTNNTVEDSYLIIQTTGIRPSVLTGNVVTGEFANGQEILTYDGPETTDPIEVCPTWDEVTVIYVGVSTYTRLLEIVTPELLPTGFTFSITRTKNAPSLTGAEIQPAAWNSFTRGYMLFADAVLVLEKGAGGTIDLVSWTPPTTNIRTIDQTETGFGLNGQLAVNLSPTVAHTYDSFAGIAIGETVTLNLNANVTLEHNAGVIEMSTGVDYVSAGTVALSATRAADGTLEVTIP